MKDASPWQRVQDGHAPLAVGVVGGGGGVGGAGHATLIDETTSNGAYCTGHATPGNARAPLAGSIIDEGARRHLERRAGDASPDVRPCFPATPEGRGVGERNNGALARHVPWFPTSRPPRGCRPGAGTPREHSGCPARIDVYLECHFGQ